MSQPTPPNMCTKSKTSFGCGHCVKAIQSCGTPQCQTLDKWKFPRNEDCGKCRAAGEVLTRGKDGRGRHGQQQARQKESRWSSADVPVPLIESPGAANLAISPWAQKGYQGQQVKIWDTPTRQKADDAWVVEHERRMSDLEETTSILSLKSKSKSSRRATPRQSYERDIEVTELFEEPEDIRVLTSRPKQVKFLPYEIEEASRTLSQPRNRKVSFESEGSMPYYQEDPRRKTHVVTPHSEYNLSTHHEPRTPRHSRSKTAPYYPQSCSFESPVPRTYPTQENWTGQYEVVQPVYHDPYYQRSHQVY